MSSTIKVKNMTEGDITVHGRVIPSLSYAILSEHEAHDFIEEDGVFEMIADGDIVINDGDDNLSPKDGYSLLHGNHSNVTITQSSEIGDKKLWVHQSAKPEIDGQQFYVQFSGAGDDMTDKVVGGGEFLHISHGDGETEKEVIVEFLPEAGDVYIHEAYAMWGDAGIGDCFCVEIYAKATPLQTSVDLHYIIDDYHRIVMAPDGNGTHGFAGNPVLLKMNDFDGYWDYNATDGLTYAADGDGNYNMMDIEILANRFMNRIPLHGTNHNYTRFVSSDTALIPAGYYIKMRTENMSGNNWHVSMMMTLFREKTV